MQQQSVVFVVHRVWEAQFGSRFHDTALVCWLLRPHRGGRWLLRAHHRGGVCWLLRPHHWGHWFLRPHSGGLLVAKATPWGFAGC